VELGEDDLDARETGARFDVDGDAAGAVAHLDAAVGVQHDVDARAVTCEGLVDGVVDDLPDAVHEAARVGGADVHAGAFADRFQPFEHLEVVGGILGCHNLQAYPPGWAPRRRHTHRRPERRRVCGHAVRVQRNVTSAGHRPHYRVVVFRGPALE